MRLSESLAEGTGYVITEQGRYALLCADKCDCNPRLYGLLIECPECGTIYGSLRDSSSRGNGRRDKTRRD